MEKARKGSGREESAKKKLTKEETLSSRMPMDGGGNKTTYVGGRKSERHRCDKTSKGAQPDAFHIGWTLKRRGIVEGAGLMEFRGQEKRFL